MKNVIVVMVAGERMAIELRWVREVLTVGHVTPVPRTPVAVVGVTNFRGAILPVLDLAALLNLADGGRPALPPCHGNIAIVLDTEELLSAVRVDNVDEVSTLQQGDTEHELVDAHGRIVNLLSPPHLLRIAVSATVREVESRKRSGP